MTNKKKLFWIILGGLVLVLAALAYLYPKSLDVQAWELRWHLMQLNNDDPSIQASAARALGEMGPKAKGAVPALIAALQSSHSEVRDAAALALGNIGPEAEAAIEPLIRVMKNGKTTNILAHSRIVMPIHSMGQTSFLGSAFLDSGRVIAIDGTAQCASVALGKIGEPALEPLIRAMKDGDLSFSAYVGLALREMGEPAVEPLLSALQDEDVRVRKAATSALQHVPPIPARAIEPLIRAMKDRDVTPYASQALLMVGESTFEPLLAALQDEDVQVRSGAVMTMHFLLPTIEDAGTRAKAVEPLIRVLKDRHWDRHWDVLQYAPVALGKVGEPAVEPLLRIVLGQDDTHGLAGVALGQILCEDPNRAPTILEPMVSRLLDEATSAGLRAQAASTLGAILFDIEDMAIRQAVVSPLITALEDDHENVRTKAASALGQILSDAQDVATVESAALSLITALEDDHEDVRAATATSLGRILHGSEDPKITKKAIEALLATPEDEAAVVRRAGANALGRILSAVAEPELGRKAVSLLLVMVEDRNAKYGEDLEAATALAKIVAALKSRELAQTAVPILIEALQDERQPYRFRASRALGWIVSATADPELARKAVPPLITALKDKNQSVREHAAESLGRIFSAIAEPELAQRATQPLVTVLQDNTLNTGVRNRAAWALVQIGTEQARDVVRNAGFNPDKPPSPPTRIH